MNIHYSYHKEEEPPLSALTPAVFPSACNIFTAGTAPPAAPRLGRVPCQLQAPRSLSPGSAIGPGAVLAAYIKLPPRTDVRDANQSGAPDVIELPIGSGRLFTVQTVEDVYRDLPGEFRRALVLPGLSPVPLP